jgi:hypothetical protein
MTATVTPPLLPAAPARGRLGTPETGGMLLKTAGRTYPHCLGPSPTNASSH